MQRIVVVGTSGSGKTTLARQIPEILGIPHLEMDAEFHREGWDSTPHLEFEAVLTRFATGERWVADGNYTNHGSRDRIWPRADTVVWLDPSKPTVMRQVTGRTLKRVITREKLWGVVTEPWSNVYSLDPERNIMVWAWTNFEHDRDKFEAAIARNEWAHADVHRLHSRRDVNEFLRLITPSAD